MNILGIETSCDETSAAVITDGAVVLSNVTASSRHVFEAAGGVIPEEAARQQVHCMLLVLHQALEAAGCSAQDIAAIAVTNGPGLAGSLLVGTTTARTLSSLWQTPLLGVHHTLGHVSSVWLHDADETLDPAPAFPCLCLSASGGHTELWYRISHTTGTLIGRTRDDAAGEAFDKGASLLGLPYPGGPAIAKAAEPGDPEAYEFPLPLKEKDTLDFSFSGLKTALKHTLAAHPDYDLSPVAASYQHAICRHLVDRLELACQRYDDVAQVHVVGGVSANTYLRTLIRTRLPGVQLCVPSKISYCTDNAAMIAAAGLFLLQEQGEAAYKEFTTTASLSLEAAMQAYA